MVGREGGFRLMDIDRNAPVCESAEAAIAAPVETVWSVLTDFAGWTTWNKNVTKMSINKPVASGTEFRWKGGGANIVSVIQIVEPPSRIVWTGRTFGIKAVHSWSLRSANGGSVVRTEESFSGVLARILNSQMRRMLKRSLEEGLAYLKQECETRHRQPAEGIEGK